MYNYRVYNNLFWIFLIQMEYRLQCMYNHMVGRAASVVSPFYSLLPGRMSLENTPTEPEMSEWTRIVIIDIFKETN